MSSSGLPALSIDPVGIGQKNALGMYQLQEAQQTLDRQRQLTPLEVQREKLQNSEAQKRSQLEDITVDNATLAKVAADTQAADPEEAASVWDSGMGDAADNGNKSARQFVGHYRPDLAERVSDLYGQYGAQGGKRTGSPGGETAAGATADTQSMDRAVASLPPQKLNQALGNLNKAVEGFNRVRDKQTWDEELQIIKDAGIDPSKFLPSLDWSPLNYAAASKAIKNLMPIRDAMQKRASVLAIGATPPAPAPLGTSQYIGITPDGQPVYHNAVTGEDVIGKEKVGPKPSAAISAFQFKQKSAEAAGMSSAEALQFANGRKDLPDERVRSMALNEANRELGNITFSGAVIPNPDEWVRQKAEENYQMLKSGTSSAGGAAPGGAPGGGGQPPPRAVEAIKGAAGKPFRFQNGQVWRWVNGKAVRIH